MHTILCPFTLSNQNYTPNNLLLGSSFNFWLYLVWLLNFKSYPIQLLEGLNYSVWKTQLRNREQLHKSENHRISKLCLIYNYLEKVDEVCEGSGASALKVKKGQTVHNYYLFPSVFIPKFLKWGEGKGRKDGSPPAGLASEANRVKAPDTKIKAHRTC
jgi:hypothetical protein